MTGGSMIRSISGSARRTGSVTAGSRLEMVSPHNIGQRMTRLAAGQRFIRRRPLLPIV